MLLGGNPGTVKWKSSERKIHGFYTEAVLVERLAPSGGGEGEEKEGVHVGVKYSWWRWWAQKNTSGGAGGEKI